ncbi:hypothetical protein [Emticicia agri]|uniref:BIG2 domain-containing protein n=1 Tax=Emticicia agri TaxID=2492393 RepID=A0A4Q5M5H4_9BACT|nr:hypothetical protein [Emticicia agri]RYU97097.1 hypothetical protein EWM59_04095 [Emticicia agri]
MLKRILIVSLIAISCTEEVEPLTISDIEVELHHDESHQFNLKRGTALVDATEIEWSSGHEKIGKIDAKGKYRARKVGLSHVTGISKGQILQASINVIPYSDILTEPIAEFGASKEFVKSKERRKFYKQLDNNTIAYEGENEAIRTVLYSFENNKLEAVTVVFTSNTAVAGEVGTFYRERYPEFKIKDPYVFCFDDDKVKVVVLSVVSGVGLSAIYIPYTTNLRVDNTADIFKGTKSRISLLDK